jgi:hypothetical protein
MRHVQVYSRKLASGLSAKLAQMLAATRNCTAKRTCRAADATGGSVALDVVDGGARGGPLLLARLRGNGGDRRQGRRMRAAACGDWSHVIARPQCSGMRNASCAAAWLPATRGSSRSAVAYSVPSVPRAIREESGHRTLYGRLLSLSELRV